MYKFFLKRTFDLILALLGIVIISPIFILTSIGLYIVNRGTPFFFQIRPGKDGQLFKIIKFKTMNDRCGIDGQLLPDRERLTSIGAFVRKTSLDEIPQLINVIYGNMSIIGPRPLLIEYLPYYTTAENKRHSVRPGITGLAQVNGRNMVNWDKRLALDIEYVENITFLNDISIIFQSVKAVLFSKGVSVDPRSAMRDLNDERQSKSFKV